MREYSNRHERDEAVCRAVESALRQYEDVVACYALTSYDNELMAKAVRDMGLTGRIPVIGTDLSETTAGLLRKGELKAIIDQGAYVKGYSGLSILVNSIIKHMDPPQRVDCPIDIVLQGNLDFYERYSHFRAASEI